MEIRILLAALGGFFIGCAFVYVRLRSGLTREEWQYFKEFLACLRAGAHEHVSDEEGSEDDGTQD